MVLDSVANFVRGSTDAAVDSTQTTVSVVDASIFPDPASDGEYNVVVWDAAQYPRPDQDPDVEILRVTAVDTGTNDLIVTRGQEGTAGASHPSGSAVQLSPTAKMFEDIEATFGDFWDAPNQELTGDVNTDTATIAKHGSHADLVIRKQAGNIVAINGRDNSVMYEGSDFTTVVQNAVDDLRTVTDKAHIHFASPFTDSSGIYQASSPITLPFFSCYVSGSGKNKTNIQPATGVNTDIFILESSERGGAIYEFRGIKIDGRDGGDTSGSGIVNKNINEIQCYSCEIRSMPDYAIDFELNTGVAGSYNKFVDTWILDNGTGGVKLSGANENTIETDFIGCTLLGVAGAPAVTADEANNAENVNITGGTLKGADVIDANAINWLSVTGVQGLDLSGSYTIRIGDGSVSTFEATVSSCTFNGMDVTNNIVVGANANNVNILGNTFGSSGSAVLDNGGSFYAFNNRNYGDRSTTNDAMTANPESDTEDGYLTVTINGTNYQIPFYQT